ncbi:YlbG family protein [Lentilactobacillus sp. SPB1-3]|uniref:DUF2129 domain-containing protein n=1 Tax=Lentilactobacillus terminaliae TaxID=3003483 RepID=A0ACD5DE46_9LACO|nr:YlbG family protein [Lentilactobacillus sp. SPB1-3]MCZ0977866.1 YlbG family protein [Lentilactobacillus sp. SPB1-3]
MNFSLTNRVELIVYLHSPRQVRSLNTFGKVIYFSKRLRYALMYVDAEAKDEIIAKLEAKHYVKEVIESRQYKLRDSALRSLSGETEVKDDTEE